MRGGRKLLLKPSWAEVEIAPDDIAIDLGFTEPSAFHRAFRKWTLKSPGAFRREGSSMHDSADAAVNAEPLHPDATSSRKADLRMAKSDYS